MAAALIDSLALLDEDEEPVTSKELIGDVAAERSKVWSTRSDFAGEFAAGDQLVAVKCNGGRGAMEHCVRIRNGQAAPVLVECKVSFEPLPPCALVEYKFNDEASGPNSEWRLSMVCLEYLLAFRAGKFKDWEKRLIQPTCKAEFRRMVAIGPVYNVFDQHMFPSATPEEKAKFEVADDNGKKVVLPRPVSELRIWSVEKQAYEVVDATLDGAPAPGERDAYWKGMIEKLKENFPEEVEELKLAEGK